ncbi:DUF4349 domain-containing protein [Oerskovia flava]|uniref:DUF4349 domain-containing protein n=1 Tax=Oerskovia flava TaxID=2986422 RepID=UPI00223FA9BE|nr:DUF4349 domain-containing protein [Oerskovia sp. JB1-3-2]
MAITPRRPGLLAALLLSAALVTGCTASGGDAGDAWVSSDQGAGSDSAEEGVASDESAARQSTVDDELAAREVITTGSATVVADDAAGAVGAIQALVDSAGGYLEARHESAATDDRPGWANVTARIPADRMTATIDGLDGVGTVQDIDLDSVDVTGTVRDLDARIDALRASVTRLTTLMAEAGSTAELLAAEQELTTRQSDLESLESQRAGLAEQVAMSTLHIEVTEVAETPQLAPGGFLGGLTSGWNALLATLNGLVVVVGVLLPWIVPAGVIALLVRWVVRRVRRPAPDASAGGGAGGTGDGDGPGDPGSGGTGTDAGPVPGSDRLVGAGSPER